MTSGKTGDNREQAEVGWGWVGGPGRVRPGKKQNRPDGGLGQGAPGLVSQPALATWRPTPGQPDLGVCCTKARSACLPNPPATHPGPTRPQDVLTARRAK